MRMVEKIARAIEPGAFRCYDDRVEYCLRLGCSAEEAKASADLDHGFDVSVAMIKAGNVLELFRTPSDAILLAMAEVLRSCDNEVGFMSEASEYVEDAKRVHAAMIDKAIQESGE
jgi:hypothetical protein